MSYDTVEASGSEVAPVTVALPLYVTSQEPATSLVPSRPTATSLQCSPAGTPVRVRSSEAPHSLECTSTEAQAPVVLSVASSAIPLSPVPEDEDDATTATAEDPAMRT